MRLRRPHYAEIAATLALVVAMSGTAYAAVKLDPNSVDTAAIQNGAVTNPKIAVNAVKSGTILNSSILAADLADGAVTGPKLGPDAVDATKVLDGSLSGADIANESLTSDDLATDSVQATEIADDSIDGGEIIDNSLGSVDIAPGAITNSELGTDAVDSSKVASNSLTLSDLLGADVTGSVGSFVLSGGVCGSININIGGAQVGQAVLISFTTAPPNAITWSPARVSAPGVVTVSVCNQSGSTITSSGQGIRIVTFG